MSSDLFKNVINKMCLQIMYLIYMYKADLVLNNLQGLICHKIQLSQAWHPFDLTECLYFLSI